MVIFMASQFHFSFRLTKPKIKLGAHQGGSKAAADWAVQGKILDGKLDLGRQWTEDILSSFCLLLQVRKKLHLYLKLFSNYLR